MDAVTEVSGLTENSTAKAPTSQALDTKNMVNGKMVRELDGSVEANKTDTKNQDDDDK